MQWIAVAAQRADREAAAGECLAELVQFAFTRQQSRRVAVRLAHERAGTDLDLGQAVAANLVQGLRKRQIAEQQREDTKLHGAPSFVVSLPVSSYDPAPSVCR